MIWKLKLGMWEYEYWKAVATFAPADCYANLATYTHILQTW